MTKTYDLVIVGSGTAAQVASVRVRAAGWEVAVIDHQPFGGACALRGCDPKKMLISAAEAIDAARRMRGHGVSGDLRVDWRELMAFKRSFTDDHGIEYGDWKIRSLPRRPTMRTSRASGHSRSQSERCLDFGHFCGV
jgi:pyruvate/2-oxoglutarate dehydrogenase complex dihydrolipoamide dehydrogenase (E3) component